MLEVLTQMLKIHLMSQVNTAEYTIYSGLELFSALLVDIGTFFWFGF